MSDISDASEISDISDIHTYACIFIHTEIRTDGHCSLVVKIGTYFEDKNFFVYTMVENKI